MGSNFQNKLVLVIFKKVEKIKKNLVGRVTWSGWFDMELPFILCLTIQVVAFIVSFLFLCVPFTVVLGVVHKWWHTNFDQNHTPPPTFMTFPICFLYKLSYLRKALAASLRPTINRCLALCTQIKPAFGRYGQWDTWIAALGRDVNGASALR